MGGRTVPWAGAVAIAFVVLVLTIFVAIFSALRSCSIEFNDNVVVFGTAFDAEHGETMLLWPADGNGDAFRCVAFSQYESLHEQPVHVIAGESGWKFPFDAPDAIARVLLVLPPDASGALRARANAVLDAAAAWTPGAGLHLVQGTGKWSEATTSRAASLLLRRLSERSGEIRSEMGTFGDLFAEAMTSLIAPTVVVIVRDDDALPFVVARRSLLFGRSFDPEELSIGRELNRVDLEEYLKRGLGETEPEFEDSPIEAILPFVVFVVPADASTAATDRAVEMVRQVAASEGRVAGLHRSRWTTAELLGEVEAR